MQESPISTGLTLHGLVRHLEHVERSWIRDVFAAEDGLSYAWTDEDPDAELRVPAGTPMAQLQHDYEAESGRCDAVVAAAPGPWARSPPAAASRCGGSCCT